MATDPFDDLLELENDYYKEGYDAGVSDSAYAGMVEGKVFGIEKGYEKALELGRLHGRALIWQGRLAAERSSIAGTDGGGAVLSDPQTLGDIVQSLPKLSDSVRLQRHLEALKSTSDPSNVAKDNSDEAVTEFDYRIAKSRAKVKMVANFTGELANPPSATNAGIEDASGLQARR